ncbi:MAG: cache domain-containing protein, partial [Spirochaetaceae bacterium]|nr:cache domain-containing protein [Spirochaetaceae bacterium]
MAMKELDRFDTTARRGVRLQTKLIGLIGGCILLCCTVVAFVSLTVFDTKLIENTQNELRYTEHGAKNVMQDWVATLTMCSDLLSDVPAVMQAAAHSGADGMSSYLKGKVDSLDLDFAAIIDSKGIVVASSGSELAVGKNVSYIKGVSNALKDIAAQTFEAAGTSEFSALAASPIKDGGKVVGCVLSGYDLTDGFFTNLMQKTYNVESTVFKDYVRMESTIPNVIGTVLDNQAIVDKVLRGGESFEGKNIIKGKAYYSTYQPLFDSDGTIKGMLFVAKDVDVVNAVKMTTLVIVIPAVVILIIILMAFSYSFIHWLMWRIYNVTNFLKELETGEADLTKRCKLFI